jgi:uncharacterized coiled-coil protein SlyX
MDEQRDEQRLIDLETKFSYQEMLIEELRQTVHGQYVALEKLEKNLKLLTDRVKSGDEGVNAAHEKPPHY